MRSLLAALIVSSGLLAGCSFDSVVGLVDPYRIDVRQGNYVDQEMVAQLRRGMTRDQVRYVLGSPLVVDMFRTDRWDYVYRFRPGSGEAQQRVISLFFAGDVLERIEGDVAAASGEPVAQPQQRSRVVEIPPATVR
ncbi:outer membrane protein assembly factor BamE [Thauera sp.]|jgi:outer membrane protein assembly factor BamE|uniref:outer membrane protein assembly factor BamE n=1 Tax=Thauera sp. TaxID=1905334 RepID=UPI001A38AAB2|nr:outer membrane protein assembly factor BamE [Thauera sp.]MBL8463870.1 outer membrane protein assembly factor BamE [Thauera sp.]HRO37550.1 outer membrane protein assembly factor BamE [Thauera sp.]